jgi:hypothetical protein
MNAFYIIGGVFLLLCAYSAQYWAKQCFTELRAIRKELEGRK